MPEFGGAGDPFHAPWSQPGFGYVALVLAVLLLLTLVAVVVVATRGRGGAPRRTLLARWFTWSILGPLFGLVVFAGFVPTAVLLALFALQGLREWSALLGLGRAHRVLLAAYAVLAFVLALSGPTALLATVPLLFLGAMLLPIVRADTSRGMRDLAFGALGFAYLPLLLAFGVLMVRDFRDGSAMLFVAAAAAGCSDIGAYVVGKSLGRRPLAPSLSPNKTIEGAAGNLLGAAFAFLVFGPVLPLLSPAGLVALPVLVGIGAIFGDLFKSALKREVGVKDAGTLVPGFGGLLDRIDSVIVAVPLVYYALVTAAITGLAAAP